MPASLKTSKLRPDIRRNSEDPHCGIGWLGVAPSSNVWGRSSELGLPQHLPAPGDEGTYLATT